MLIVAIFANETIQEEKGADDEVHVGVSGLKRFDIHVLARLTPDTRHSRNILEKCETLEQERGIGRVWESSHMHPIGDAEVYAFMVYGAADPTPRWWAPSRRHERHSCRGAARRIWDWRGWECRCKTVVLCRWVCETVTSPPLIGMSDRQIGLSGQWCLDG